MNTRTIFTALAAISLVACGDSRDPSGPGDDYGFELAVSGDMTAELEGDAFFGEDTGANGEPVFAILLMNEDEESMVLLAKPGTQRPGVGSYTFAVEPGNSSWSGALTSTDGDELLGFFIAESGTITITESTATRLRGTIQFQGSGFVGDLEIEADVTVSGEFDARRAPTTGTLQSQTR